MLRSAVNYEDNFESCVCVLHITSFRLREFLPCKPICLKPTPSSRARATSTNRCNHPLPRALPLLPYPTVADRSLSVEQIRTKSHDRFAEFFSTPTPCTPTNPRVGSSWKQDDDALALAKIVFHSPFSNSVIPLPIYDTIASGICFQSFDRTSHILVIRLIPGEHTCQQHCRLCELRGCKFKRRFEMRW